MNTVQFDANKQGAADQIQSIAYMMETYNVKQSAQVEITKIVYAAQDNGVADAKIADVICKAIQARQGLQSIKNSLGIK
jgi:hypothetical protein